MFGLENKAKRPLFEFDLEKNLKKNPAEVKKMIEHVERKVQQLKEVLRQGTQSHEFNEAGVLLHGYTCLLRVLSRIGKKK